MCSLVSHIGNVVILPACFFKRHHNAELLYITMCLLFPFYLINLYLTRKISLGLKNSFRGGVLAKTDSSTDIKVSDKK